MLELHRRVSEICRRDFGETYELVLVNDGSDDNTWAVMCDLAAQDPNIVAINLSRNFGHQIALSAGLSICAANAFSSSTPTFRTRRDCSPT